MRLLIINSHRDEQVLKGKMKSSLKKGTKKITNVISQQEFHMLEHFPVIHVILFNTHTHTHLYSIHVQPVPSNPLTNEWVSLAW